MREELSKINTGSQCNGNRPARSISFKILQQPVNVIVNTWNTGYVDDTLLHELSPSVTNLLNFVVESLEEGESFVCGGQSSCTFPLTQCTIHEYKTGNDVSEFTHSNWITLSYYSSPKHNESAS